MKNIERVRAMERALSRNGIDYISVKLNKDGDGTAHLNMYGYGGYIDIKNYIPNTLEIIVESSGLEKAIEMAKNKRIEDNFDDKLSHTTFIRVERTYKNDLLWVFKPVGVITKFNDIEL